jgi:chromatin segregation and condensation protein Rec8/ScpA/Scc1 (kleisin family)
MAEALVSAGILAEMKSENLTLDTSNPDDLEEPARTNKPRAGVARLWQ